VKEEEESMQGSPWKEKVGQHHGKVRRWKGRRLRLTGLVKKKNEQRKKKSLLPALPGL